MKLREVNFEGTAVKMPFLSVEDCMGHHLILGTVLSSLEGKDVKSGICSELMSDKLEGYASQAERHALQRMAEKLFDSTMPVSDDPTKGCYAYLPSYVAAQLNTDTYGWTLDQKMLLCNRVRRFWIDHQLSILKEAKT